MDLAQAFKKWGRDFYAFVYLRVKDRQVAEDLVQEIFMKAWRNRENFDAKKSSLKTWLFVLTRNILFDYYKDKARNSAGELNENIESDHEVEREVETKILTEKVYEQLGKLSEKEQQLIIFRYKLDYKVRDIAEIMEISLSDAKVSLHRALSKLKEFCNDNL